MAPSDCGREAETIRAAWNAAGAGADDDPALAAHLACCPGCAEIARLARDLRQDRDAAFAEARPPSAAVVWWRAQRRAREEGARRAERPIALIHAVSLGCSAAAAVALASIGATRLHDWPGFAALRDLATQALSAGAAAAGPGWTTPLMVVLVASLVLAPVAVYFAALGEK